MKIFIFVILFSMNSFAVEMTCPAGKYLVRSHHRDGYTRSDGTIVKPAMVKAYCKDRTEAYDYIEGRLKNNSPQPWPNKTEKIKKWSEQERSRVIEALENFPDVLLSENIKGIYRMERSKDYPNPASNSESGFIVLYDTSFDKSHDLRRVLTHELSHQSFRDLNKEDSLDYRLATGWQVDVGIDRMLYWTPRASGYVEDDGKSSAAEDYSNNLEYYLHDSDKLKKVTPSAYRWFQKHFGNDFRLKGTKK